MQTEDKWKKSVTKLRKSLIYHHKSKCDIFSEIPFTFCLSYLAQCEVNSSFSAIIHIYIVFTQHKLCNLLVYQNFRALSRPNSSASLCSELYLSHQPGSPGAMRSLQIIEPPSICSFKCIEKPHKPFFSKKSMFRGCRLPICVY